MNKPIAYIPATGLSTLTEEKAGCVANATKFDESDIPLYNHPAKELPTKEDEYWLMVEVLRAKVKEQQAEIEALEASKDRLIKTLLDVRGQQPVAWAYIKDGEFWDAIHPDEHAQAEGSYTIPLYTHPVKEQSNLVNVVKDHIEDLVRCVKLFRSYEMDNTADEMEVAIKALEDAIEAHPVKELTNIVVASATCSCGKVMEVTNLQPVKELNDGGEPVKNATYWKRQHDNLLMKLNTCAIKASELEKKLDIRTRELIGASFYEYDYKTLMEKPPLTDKEIEILKEIIRITDRKHQLWDKAKEFLK